LARGDPFLMSAKKGGKKYRTGREKKETGWNWYKSGGERQPVERSTQERVHPRIDSPITHFFGGRNDGKKRNPGKAGKEKGGDELHEVRPNTLGQKRKKKKGSVLTERNNPREKGTVSWLN